MDPVWNRSDLRWPVVRVHRCALSEMSRSVGVDGGERTKFEHVRNVAGCTAGLPEVWGMMAPRALSNIAVDRTAGSHSLAAAGHRERYPDNGQRTIDDRSTVPLARRAD